MTEPAPRLLVVDDDEPSRELAVEIFESLGWTVDQVEGGRQALAWLREHRPDCVLLDISMPGMAGDEVCRRIRSEPHLAGVRIVAYTAHAFPEDIQSLRATGFDAVVVKPCVIEQLIAAVENPAAG